MCIREHKYELQNTLFCKIRNIVQEDDVIGKIEEHLSPHPPTKKNRLAIIEILKI
jgi:hypothetical protein